MPYDLAIPSMKDRVSAEEWDARVNLAACYRLVALYGMTDMVANHISVRVPGEEHNFLLNPYGLFYDEITASSLIKVDVRGNIVEKPDFEYGINRAGFVIHGAIHEARADVACVIHTHTPAGMAVSALKCGLLPLSQTSMRFGRLAYHAYEGVAIDLDEQARLVADLGDADAMILRNHGLLTCGPTIAEAFNTLVRLEMACVAQIMAMSCNSELIVPSADVVARTNEQYRPRSRRAFGVLEWPGLLRKLDRIDPSYRD
jgi:ribulose-5-phosphate 4-epimerase/fuculose-1-phosphate aldolase